jgi:CPA1 family monovalent cation:H+ antiporter
MSSVAQTVSGIIILLLIAAAVMAVTRRLHIPFTIMLVVVGMTLHYLENYLPILEPLSGLQISADLIFFVFLPTLIFESAYNMDGRLLRHNLIPVMMLAVPGFLVSTALIGISVAALTQTAILGALLLGAILSATDPVAVIALFKEIGAPKRLTILVEGESLFNDATAMVVAGIILEIIHVGSFTTTEAVSGMANFFILFFGGFASGWIMGMLAALILGKVGSVASIEITLTTVLAYASFIFAENVLGVSGVMATLAAGLTLGNWGRTKISPAVRKYLDHFWEYLSFIANALIFLMVGLRLDLGGMFSIWKLLAVVVLAMLGARAAMIYGLMPVLGRIHNQMPVARSYQTVMFWGGLRGAIAVAIALSLPVFENSEIISAAVMGAVLFTLFVQGFTIRPLMQKLELDRPPLADQLARLELALGANLHARNRMSEISRGGLFSGSIATRLQSDVMIKMDSLHNELDELRARELDPRQERHLLFMRVFADEKACYAELFKHGQLSESAYRELTLRTDMLLDHARYDPSFIPDRTRKSFFRILQEKANNILDKAPLLAPLAERLREARVARNQEEAWGEYQAGGQVLMKLEQFAKVKAFSPELIGEFTIIYRNWRQHSRSKLDHVAEQYPEFFNAMQERLGRQIILQAEAEEIEEQERQGALPKGITEQMLTEIEHDMHAVENIEPAGLHIEPGELLRAVPFFSGMPPEAFARIAAQMRLRTLSEGEVIIEQGQLGKSLFLIARGVVRVSRHFDGANTDLATLVAGDFFGEIALLSPEPRSATVKAITPCSVYALDRENVHQAMEEFPQMAAALNEALRSRKAEQEKISRAGSIPGQEG